MFASKKTNSPISSMEVMLLGVMLISLALVLLVGPQTSEAIATINIFKHRYPFYGGYYPFYGGYGGGYGGYGGISIGGGGYGRR